MVEFIKGFYLRPVKLSDANALFEFSKDESVVKYLSWEAHQTINDTIKVIKEHYFKNNPISYVIVDSNDTAIGVIDFNTVTRTTHPEIGYFLNPKYHNKGIMTNALYKILDIGFNELGYDTIAISHVKENAASKKVILKNGFKFIRTIKNIKYKNKKFELLFYEMKGSDFNEQSKRNI